MGSLPGTVYDRHPVVLAERYGYTIFGLPSVGSGVDFCFAGDLLFHGVATYQTLAKPQRLTL